MRQLLAVRSRAVARGLSLEVIGLEQHGLILGDA